MSIQDDPDSSLALLSSTSLREKERSLMSSELLETVRTRVDMLEKVQVLYVKTGSLIKIARL